MTLSKREWILTIIALVILLLSSYWVFFYTPYHREMESLDDRMEKARIQNLDAQKAQDEIDDVRQKIIHFQGELSHAQAEYLGIIDDIQLIMAIQDIVNPNAYKTQVIFMEHNQQGPLLVIPLRITMETSYGGLKTILAGFEDLEIVNHISNMKIDRKSSPENIKSSFIRSMERDIPPSGITSPEEKKQESTEKDPYNLSVDMMLNFYCRGQAKSDAKSLKIDGGENIGKRNPFND